MKVILLGELRGKGGEGDVIDVAQGFAENYLFPNRLAIKATPGNLKQLEERRHNIAKREEKRIADAEMSKAALDGKTIKVDVRVGEEGQLFGSVTSQMIVDAIKDQLGIEIDRRRVERNAAIKTAGTHQVTVNLYREINATVYVVAGDVTAPEPAEEEAAEEAPEEGAETEAPAEETEQAEAEAPAEE
jgi:large subunit ribosomal protein L9